MRALLGLPLAFALLLGCIGESEGREKLDFEDELALENVSMGDWNVSVLDTDEIDAIFSDGLVEGENVTVVYFYERSCSACIALSPWLEQEKKAYGTSVIWFEYDTGTEDGWEKYLLFADAYRVPSEERYVPMVYVGGKYFWGIDGIRNDLGRQIGNCREEGCYSPFEMLKN